MIPTSEAEGPYRLVEEDGNAWIVYTTEAGQDVIVALVYLREPAKDLVRFANLEVRYINNASRFYPVA